MAKQNAVFALKESIRLLEIRQAEEGNILKEQFRTTYESLKPINLIKNSMKDFVGSVDIKNSIFETVVSLLTGYVSKKIMVRSKSNLFMKLMGLGLQFGVTNLISKNAEDIRIYLSNMVERFLSQASEEKIPETER